MKTKLSREELEQIKIKQKNRYKIEMKCDVCGKIISVDEIGNGSGCKNCGWVQDSLSEEFPDRVMCPNLIPLSKAKKLYIEEKPFLPDLDDFISGLDFYGEMQFTYQGIDYGVTRGKNDTVDLWIVNAEVLGTFKDSEKFKENAKIDGKLIKDIWQEVKDVNWLQ